MSFCSLWKQLPDLHIDDSSANEHEYDNIGRNDYLEKFRTVPRKMRDNCFLTGNKVIPPLDSRFRAMMEQKYGLEFGPWDKETWVDCPGCKRWFKNAELLRMHAAICPVPIV